MYEALQAEGYRVDYERIPITDEKSPKERDFDFLVGIVIGRGPAFYNSSACSLAMHVILMVLYPPVLHIFTTSLLLYVTCERYTQVKIV